MAPDQRSNATPESPPPYLWRVTDSSSQYQYLQSPTEAAAFRVGFPWYDEDSTRCFTRHRIETHIRYGKSPKATQEWKLPQSGPGSGLVSLCGTLAMAAQEIARRQSVNRTNIRIHHISTAGMQWQRVQVTKCHGYQILHLPPANQQEPGVAFMKMVHAMKHLGVASVHADPDEWFAAESIPKYMVTDVQDFDAETSLRSPSGNPAPSSSSNLPPSDGNDNDNDSLANFVVETDADLQENARRWSERSQANQQLRRRSFRVTLAGANSPQGTPPIRVREVFDGEASAAAHQGVAQDGGRQEAERKESGDLEEEEAIGWDDDDDAELSELGEEWEFDDENHEILRRGTLFKRVLKELIRREGYFGGLLEVDLGV